VPLQPPNHLQGRFAPAERLPGGLYRQNNDSGVLNPDLTHRRPSDPNQPHSSQRTSWQSIGVGSGSSRSSLVPRRVESLIGLEAVTAYHNQQAAQRPAGGAYYEAPGLHPVPRIARMSLDEPSLGEEAFQEPGKNNGKRRAAESIHSAGSNSSVSLHFGIPPRPREPSPPTQPRSYVPTRAPDDMPANAHLALPTPTYQPGSSAVRNGRSPLARKSFTRLAPTSPTSEQREIELEVRVPRRASGAGQDGEEERRGRRGRRSISVDGQGRRRLSKQRKGSREPN
jgi:chitin synthase